MFQVPPSVQRLAIEIEGWLDLGCPDRAIDKLKILMEVPGARPAALVLRVRGYTELGRFEEAIIDIDDVRSFDHDADWADLTEAWCRKRIGDLAGAAHCMERLLERSNHSAIGHFNLGCYLALQGEPGRALDEVTLACGIDPSFRKLLDAEEDLDSLRGLPGFQSLLEQAVKPRSQLVLGQAPGRFAHARVPTD